MNQHTRRMFNLAVTILTFIAAVVTIPARASAAESTTSVLSAGQSLASGQSLWSTDGAYQAIMQTDGNFVVYTRGRPIFHTGTGGVGAANLVMQTDGNLVVYAANGRAVWNSGTGGPTTSVLMQTDGNLVIYALGSVPLWMSKRQAGGLASSNTFSDGYCTWGAAAKWHAATGQYPGFKGDAHQWTNNAQAAGYSVSSTPQPRAVVVFPADDSYGNYGHVAWVDSVQQRSDVTYITITEMNYAGWKVWGSRVLKHTGNLRYILVPYRT